MEFHTVVESHVNLGSHGKNLFQNTKSSTVQPESRSAKLDDGPATRMCNLSIIILLALQPFLLLKVGRSPEVEGTFEEIVMKLQLWRDGFEPRRLEEVLTQSLRFRKAVLGHFIAIGHELKGCYILATDESRTDLRNQLGELTDIVERTGTLLQLDGVQPAEEESVVTEYGSNHLDTLKQFANMVLENVDHHVRLLMRLLPSLQHFLDFRRREKEDVTEILSQSKEGRLVKKPRASMPKVRSGCVACRSRRVKCDETKPQCLRCEKFGRECDGYTSEPVQSRGLIQIQPRIPSDNLYGPSFSIHSTEEEHRYFQVFHERTAYELSGFYDTTFWARLVLQESHNVAAIRHSVIALGALSKGLESAPRPDLKVNDIQCIDKKHYTQAILAHGRALQSLSSYISSSRSPQLRTALIGCLLFVCFETFQGANTSSVQQIYGGLKILRDYYTGKPGSRPWIPLKGGIHAAKISSGVTAKVSNAAQAREGYDSGYESNCVTRDMTQHVEEYLENENNPQPEVGDDQVEFTEADTPESLVKSHIHGPEFLIRHMGAPEFKTYRVQKKDSTPSSKKPYPANKHLSESISCTRNHSPEASSYCELMTPPNSTTSTSRTPFTTGPHTPSTSDPIQSQVSTAARNLATSRKRPLVSKILKPMPILQNDLTIEEVLIQSFVRLDGQSLFFGIVPGIPPLIWDVCQIWHLPIPSTPFADFPSAQRCWDFLMDRTLQFYRRTLFNKRYAPAISDPLTLIMRQYNSYTKQLSLFEKAFGPLLSIAIQPDGIVSNAAALILSLNQKITKILLATIQNDSEMMYDDYREDFAYIVRICQIIVTKQDAITLPRNTRFSLDTGIVPPLHFTASKCRDPVIRYEAIKLMSSSPRQEGLWDSLLSARIGRWLAACEQQQLPDPETLAYSVSKDQESLSETNSYLSPEDVVEHGRSSGRQESGRQTLQIVHEIALAKLYEQSAKQQQVTDRNTCSGNGEADRNTNATAKDKLKGVSKNDAVENIVGGWYVYEENRVQLTVADTHISERYMKAKCEKVWIGKNGKREERETNIGW